MQRRALEKRAFAYPEKVVCTMSNHTLKPFAMQTHSLVERREVAHAALTRAIGADKLAVVFLHPELVRSVMIGNDRYLSLVDLMNVFGEDSRKKGSRDQAFNPRRYWSDHKSALLGKDKELYDSIVQLKMIAEDGKERLTDVAPIWSCLLILSFMQTPSTIDLMKAIFKGIGNAMPRTEAEMKHRARAISEGREWAADSIREAMKELAPPDKETPDEDIGYRR